MDVALSRGGRGPFYLQAPPSPPPLYRTRNLTHLLHALLPCLFSQNPSVFSCLEAEFGVRAIASQNNLRMGRELYAFGGGIIARRDRTDITRLADIKDKVVEAVSISGLGACQMQWRELQSRGLEFLSNVHLFATRQPYPSSTLRVLADALASNRDAESREVLVNSRGHVMFMFHDKPICC